MEDAKADAALDGMAKTGGAHPAVDRMHARRAAAEGAVAAAAAVKDEHALVVDPRPAAQAIAVAMDADAATKAFESIDKDGSGAISRIEVIQACKADEGVRSLLGLPEKIKQEYHARKGLQPPPGESLHAACRLLLATCCLLLAACRLPLAACCLLMADG